MKRKSSYQQRVEAAKGALKRRKELEGDRQRLNRLGEAIIRWEDRIDLLEESIAPYEHVKGNRRTKEEIVMVIQTCIALMKEAKSMAEQEEEIGYLSLTDVDFTAAKTHKFGKQYISTIRSTLEKESELIVAFGDEESGGANPKYNHQYILDQDQQAYVFNFIEEQHAEGATVTNRRLRHEIFCEFDIEIPRSTMQRYIHRMGLSWRPTRARKMTFKAYRKDAVGTFLIGYHRALMDPDAVLVYIDESYIHDKHQVKNSYQDSSSRFNKGQGNGRRLIILNAITKHGPLCTFECDLPVDNLIWNGDTPHPDRAGILTAECLWCSNSSAGDYHDNMNGEMYYQWIVEKCHPTFEKMFPGKKMVPVCDNAAYHHKRVIGSLSGMSKKDLIALAKQYEVAYLDIPLTPLRQQALERDDMNEYHYIFMKDDEEFASILIDEHGEHWDEIGLAAGKSRPFVPSKDELQIAMVSWLKQHRPDLLECKVEQYLKQHGGYCVYTPPYAAKAQPIELFWAVGKNYAAEHCFNGRSMKQTVQLLREGWHGNEHLWEDADNEKGYIGDGRMKRRKCRPIDCAGLVRTAEGYMNSLFIPIAGFSGTIDNLEVPDNWKATTEEMPMDLILSMSEPAGNGEIGAQNGLI